jgi:hypothetical protein
MRVPVRSTKCRKMGNHDIPDLDTFKRVVEIENAIQKEDAARSFQSIELESSSFPGVLRRDTDSKKIIIQIPISESFKLESEIDI